MTFTTQAAVLAEVRDENDRMRMLFTEMLAFDDAMIQSLATIGHTPHPAMFPFTDRMREFARA